MKNPDHHNDVRFMSRALELASNGSGQVSPNPLVGCVVVHNDKIVGEGWHAKYGEAHAEVNAVWSVQNKSLLKESTVYVSLEPCAHFGKTPPCADMLITHQVRRVVVANLDSNPLVAGSGIKKLRDAGIQVTTGVCEDEGREMNRRFFTFMEKKRPHVILKWAQTADGFIARENYDSKWISNVHARQLVHKWRAEEDAVLAGTNTVAFDNPQLNVRDWTGRDPVRVVIDKFQRLDGALHVFDNKQKTICYNVVKHEAHGLLLHVRVDEQNFLENILADLYQRKIQSVIVEGGAKILNAFINAGLWDEARVFFAGQVFKKGIKAPQLQAHLIREESIMGDTLRWMKPLQL